MGRQGCSYLPPQPWAAALQSWCNIHAAGAVRKVCERLLTMQSPGPVAGPPPAAPLTTLLLLLLPSWTCYVRSWKLDGVQRKRGIDMSCVRLITAGSRSVLLTGSECRHKSWRWCPACLVSIRRPMSCRIPPALPSKLHWTLQWCYTSLHLTSQNVALHIHMAMHQHSFVVLRRWRLKQHRPLRTLPSMPLHALDVCKQSYSVSADMPVKPMLVKCV